MKHSEGRNWKLVPISPDGRKAGLPSDRFDVVTGLARFREVGTIVLCVGLNFSELAIRLGGVRWTVHPFLAGDRRSRLAGKRRSRQQQPHPSTPTPQPGACRYGPPLGQRRHAAALQRGN